MTDEGRRGAVIDAVQEVRGMPYEWPAEPTAAAARASGRGSCASKHALVAERLELLDVSARPLLVVGPLVPPALAADPEIGVGVRLVEVHECLTVSMPGVGPVRVDVTWDPPLVHRGLPGTLEWDGRSDMAVAIGESAQWWAPDPTRLRQDKEALRSRLYVGSDRAVRDAVLAAMSAQFARWRGEPLASAQ